MDLLNYYKDLLAKLIVSGNEKIATGIIGIMESIEIAESINTLAEAIDEIEEYYGIEDESDSTEVNDGGF